ncbi:hypothetical protein FOZ60_015223, partial [Perkinsus olseni]
MYSHLFEALRLTGRMDKIAIYHLKGEPELYYLLRNFSGPLRDDINVMIREKLSEGLSSSDIVMRVWEYLDDRFSGTFNKGEALLRWERLAQKEDERVEDYFVRIDKESSLLCSVFGKQHLELEKCRAWGRRSIVCRIKELRGEAMHFESQLSSGKNRWEAKSSPDLAPKRAAAGAYSPDILGVIAGVKSREIWPRDVLAADSGIDWQIVQFLLRSEATGYGSSFKRREGGGEEEREEWVSIYGEAHLFPDRAEAWHANRREMFAILQSLTALCQQFERNWWRSLRTIVLGSDSFTAIRRMGGPERKLKGIEWLATRRIRDCTDDIIAELKTMSISVSFIHHPNTSFFTKRVDILSRIIDDIPFSRELLSIHASRDVPLTAIDLTVAIDDSEVPLLAFEVFDLYYPHSLLLPTLENVPSLKTYYDLDKTFHAWKGDSATPKHELIRRFLIREQEKDPLCREVRHLLEEGADLSKKKRSVAPAVVYYGENAFLHNDVLCKKDPVDDEDDVRIVLPKSKYSRLPVELIKYYHDLRGHPAVNSTHRYLRRLFWWPRSRADVKSVIRSCHPCQVSASFLKRQHEAHLWTPSEPFEVLGLDIVGPLLPSSKGE